MAARVKGGAGRRATETRVGDETREATRDGTQTRPRYDRAGLLALLDRLGIETETIEHPAVATVEEADATHDALPGAHTKNLFVRDKKGRVFLVVVPSHIRADLKALHPIVGAQGRVSFGKPELLWELLGVRPGSVTVFGAANDVDGRVTVVLDGEIAEADVVCGHPLENTATTAIAQADLRRFLAHVGHEPMVVRVPRDGEG